MIAKLTGGINELRPSEVIIDVQGVGYLCSIPLTTYMKLQGQKSVTLHIYTLHRDDQLKLFGFSTCEEKNMFTVLMGISGVGPALALSILSGVSIDELVDAVRSGNTAMLMKIPGIGKAKAEKLVFELTRKIAKLEPLCTAAPRTSSVKNDSLDALVSLGFDEQIANRVVDALVGENPDIGTEELIKAALKHL